MPSLNHRKVLGFQLVESTSMKIDYIAQNDLEENKEWEENASHANLMKKNLLLDLYVKFKFPLIKNALMNLKN